jgi:hypothetical protein
MKRWRRFIRLDAASRLLVVHAAITLTATRIGLRLFDHKSWEKLLGWYGRKPQPQERVSDSTTLENARAVRCLEESAARHLFFRPTCLERSLVLRWLLRCRGIESELRLGARKADRRFEAHAWVEVCGAALNDESHQHQDFTVFGADSRPEFETESP